MKNDCIVHTITIFPTKGSPFEINISVPSHKPSKPFIDDYLKEQYKNRNIEFYKIHYYLVVLDFINGTVSVKDIYADDYEKAFQEQSKKMRIEARYYSKTRALTYAKKIANESNKQPNIYIMPFKFID